MTPEKGRHKHAHIVADMQKQAHLEVKNEEQDLSSRIDRLVSLTYDSDSAVRRNAAEELAKIDDPRSIFALLEMSSDKDEGVKERARNALDKFGQGAEKEAIVNLEKIFEARSEGKPQAQDDKATKQMLMPSIEKLFSNMDAKTAERVRAKLMPSIEKLFGMQITSVRQSAADSQVPLHPAVPSPEEVRRAAPAPEAERQAPPAPMAEADSDDDDGGEENPLGVQKIEDEEKEGERENYLPPKPSSSLSPKAQGEAAADFPLPNNLKSRTASPIAEIESMMPETQQSFSQDEDEAVSLPPARIDFYKWAYALAVDPKMTAAKIRSEEKRLISELKKDVELAFRLAIVRARVTGIESLSGLKPGMRKVATFPLIVSEVRMASVQSGKKQVPMARILLTDGKHSVPLYIEPSRSSGIASGDHLSLHDARVDFFVESNELVFLLGKKGYISVNK